MDIAHRHLSIAPTVQLPFEGVNRLQELAAEDVLLIVHIYQAILRVQELWTSTADNPDQVLLRQQLAIFAQSDFISAVQSIGFATLKLKEGTPSLHHLFYELRGGCMASLVLYVDLMEKRPNHPSYLLQAVHFAQNHLHTMQRLLPDLLQLEPKITHTEPLHQTPGVVK